MLQYDENHIFDIRTNYFEFFERFNNKRVKFQYSMNYIEFTSDEQSEYIIKYENIDDNISIFAKKIEGFHISNIYAYLSHTLQTLNGRSVVLTFNDDMIKISPDIFEKDIYGLYYTNNNYCEISGNKVKEICKIGTDDCCIFCSVGGNGFECLKFDTHSARLLLHRYSKGLMKANRIGNCEILGRKEKEFKLMYCNICVGVTNHLGNECQKCK